MTDRSEKIRVSLAKNIFSPISGFILSDWLKLLSQQRFLISPKYFLRALFITLNSFNNSFYSWQENRKYYPQIRDATVRSPVFILGHWRSGTTHLHNLITVDPQFAYPNFYQATQPHTFLSTERRASSSKMLRMLTPKTRLIDNVSANLDAPMEDEVALAILTSLSPIFGSIFPLRADYYDKYLTFREASAEEVAFWKKEFVFFLKKLELKYNRPIVLKSPPHTCRIKLILDIFPEARFIHIHRNPYVVYQSYKRSIKIMNQLIQLQRSKYDSLDDHIIEQYRVMYDIFFEERSLIPENQFYEISYEELEKNPLIQMRSIYEKLKFRGFDNVEPLFQNYIKSLAGYKKSELPQLEPSLRKRISKEWQRCFEEWDYIT